MPVVPMNRFVHDFVDLDPTKHARRVFRRYFFLTCTAGGVLFAYATVDGKRQQNDPWFSRPDLKPFKAMVAKEDLDVNERQAYEAHYKQY